MAAFLNVPEAPRGASQGAGVPWRPVRSTSSLEFRRIKSPDRDALVPSQRGREEAQSRRPGFPWCTFSVSTKSALNPSACWPGATLDAGWIVLVGLRNGCLFDQMLCGGQGTLQCFRKYTLLNLSLRVLGTCSAQPGTDASVQGFTHSLSTLDACTIIWHKKLDSFCY